MKYLKDISKVLLSIVLILGMQACSTPSDEDISAKNIIFLIGDGMGLHQMYAAMTVNGGSLAMEQVSHVGLQKNQSANRYITDSAASGTALACGAKTNNGVIGMDADSVDIESILKVAERHGLATGLVSTSAITHATPAAFIANDTSRNNYEAIAGDFLLTDIDVFIGGGLDHFTKRADGRDLVAELEAKDYQVVTSIEDCEAITAGKLAALTAPVHNPRATDGRGDMLPIATRKAISILDQDEDGFFMMVEGSQIDWGGHANDEDYVISETLDFDKAVEAALTFAREDGETLVVITADHETGGMMILNGDTEKGTITTTFNTGGHTGIPIPVYAYGPGAELFTGIYENSGFKARFMKALGLSD